MEWHNISLCSVDTCIGLFEECRFIAFHELQQLGEYLSSLDTRDNALTSVTYIDPNRAGGHTG
jgi:hypothetical protein